ncbi:MAG TPA: DUF4197 domain-containing protein [Cyclobacteriaceae bacterium]|jgi:hypothetical protein|nr:DUF4197 domain-containing protein [Cyclobacteriaceae bacterium]
MKKSTIYSQLIFCFLTITLSTQAQFGLTNEEVGNGLKEALTQGISKGADALSQADGYFKNPLIKIPFPPDAKKMEKSLRDIGMGQDVDKFILTLNRGAEDAAKQAKPIFVDAIKKMTITDVMAILKGQPDAATQYLKKNTSAQLTAQFKPVIKASLDKVGATKHYKDLATAYDKIPFVKKVNPDLEAYTADLAIQGLFLTIANEEKNIRANPTARTTDLLKKVFGQK